MFQLKGCLVSALLQETVIKLLFNRIKMNPCISIFKTAIEEIKNRNLVHAVGWKLYLENSRLVDLLMMNNRAPADVTLA